MNVKTKGMIDMGKPNKRHHELCLRYKQEGRREKNKKLRAERNERRIAKFAKRREAKGEPEKKYADPENRGTNREPSHWDSAWTPKQEHMDEYSKLRSILKRAQNQIDAVLLEEKREAMAKRNKKEGKKQHGEKVS